jgi:hypothetical protein
MEPGVNYLVRYLDWCAQILLPDDGNAAGPYIVFCITQVLAIITGLGCGFVLMSHFN